MWIRSQNKETLINCNVIEYNDFYVENAIVATSETISRTIVGKYSTKEKALKVLDMIQQQINTCVEQKQTIRPATINSFEPYESKSHIVFVMPQDNEVQS